MIRSAFFVALLAGAISLPAFAQAPSQPAQGTQQRVRGTIVKLNGHDLSVKSREGANLVIKMSDNYTVRAAAKVNLTDLKSNDYVGVAAAKGKDGKLHALSVQVFPEAQRGAGEGQRDWDLTPDSSMTNATISQVTSASDGRTLNLKYKGADAAIEVAANTPVFATVPGDPSLLTPGKAVVIGALKQADGTLTASNVSVEKDGVKPAN